ncbi:MAG: thiamine pyrophosphate-dependent enzyme, partial [Pseudomonadota bacterium]
ERATNASIAVHMAQQASIPLVLCIGQVQRDFLGRDSFQEMNYQQFYGGLCKAVFDINTVGEIENTLSDAFATALNGRPGPVAIVFPEDVLKAFAESPTAETKVTKRCVEISAAEVNGSLHCIANAERPLIVAGGPLWSDSAANDLTAFAARLKIPVLTAFRRNDVVDNYADCFAGYLGLNQAAELTDTIAAADCILVLGPRLDEPTTGGYQLSGINKHATQQWIHVYPQFDALKLAPKSNVSIETSPAAWLGHALETTADADFAVSDVRQNWYQSCRQQFLASTKDEFHGKYDPALLNLPRVMTELNALLPDDAIVTSDAGNFTLWPQRLRLYRRPGRFLAPINGAMGFGLPSGIAASLTYPNRTVVSFVGDGGFLMTGMELSTAVKYGAKPIILVFNNALYGTIDSHQRRDYPGREHGNELHNPNFVDFAESFGAAAVRVKGVEDFANALMQARQLDELAVIELCLH